MRIKLSSIIFVTFFFLFQTVFFGQKKQKEDRFPSDKISINGLKWRNVGPALTSGRISDIAVNPNNFFEYFIATSSGGVWKTVNAGVDYTPIFDSQGSYSIGCVTIDPNNSNIIWVGTGENNNQRSVAYGDGVYKSLDGGKSWQHMGLKNAEHIGNIVVHPSNSNIVYVAAYGPLWSKGGDRGVYKTTDGGKTWENVLFINEHTGVNEVLMDPRNPDALYAAAHQRRRHVFTYVDGGPGSGIHKSEDGGKTWFKIQSGLPTVELGRIGMAISKVNPDVLYAIVAAADNKGGFYRSTNRGASWEKQSNYSTSGNYYQEIFTDPVNVNTVYAMDVWIKVSNDGGKTFNNVGEDYKHVDNHAMWINPNNTNHWLVGCDGGIYETFDAAKNWDFKENLPVTQFYKVALDNNEPFYNIYGGTQDNFSLGGPSRVISDHGITNQDWFITHGGDGFESQIDPYNPNIIYAQSQYGVLVRYDKLSGEEVGIQPMERKGENTYKWNWDAPLAVSQHAKGRLYFAANKVFRSNDYGNSWEVISDDLTRKIDRNSLKVYDRVLSIDAVAKNGSTSPYGTIVALSESVLNENLIAIGTDDGLIQITENGGETWRKIDNIPGAPKQSYVNSIYLSQHNENVMYAAFNHHKYGDFKPYIFKSEDKGNSWTAIHSNLPNRGSVYAIEEDHINANLIFVGTEFGAYFSPDKGINWWALSNGLPTVAVRDIAIQKRENDLVLATFGRGFFVLDDYTALREVANENTSAKIYPVRDALAWEKSIPLGLPGKAFQGDNFYSAPNLGPEAIITYYYNDAFESLKEKRQKQEREQIKNNSDTPYPSYEALKQESNEPKPQLLFTIKNDENLVVKKIMQPVAKGVQRFYWDLRYSTVDPISFYVPSFYNPWAGKTEGTLVNPGKYTVEMALYSDGNLQTVAQPVSFNVKALNNTIMPAENRAEKVAFQRKIAQLAADMQASQKMIGEMNEKIKYFKEAIKLAEAPIDLLSKEIADFEKKLQAVSIELNGDPLKSQLDLDQIPSPANRIGTILYEQKYTTSTPTQTHKNALEIVVVEFTPIQKRILNLYKENVAKIESELIKINAPYTPGRLGVKN